jgi:AraC family transcriptional regulator of adaptative response/methylated-DNA-[protein]-cysteine methyltransferase
MEDQHYDRIAGAIDYLSRHADEQPSLDETASRAGLSAFHFQRLFRKYAGVTPKQFLQHLTVERAKRLLGGGATVLDAALDLGLSSPARLHDHFVTLEAVTPGDFKAGGADLTMRYGTAATPFGKAFVAQTSRGICAFAFVDDEGEREVVELAAQWPLAQLARDDAGAQRITVRAFGEYAASGEPLRIAVQGTNFQIRVWRALLDIPFGTVASYRQLALRVCDAKAARAVGNALARNPVGVLIPCHRVITNTGSLGNYRWEPHRKRALIAWEAARKDERSA